MIPVIFADSVAAYVILRQSELVKKESPCSELVK